jgi:4,5-dihydroxyphthalate decarboxylase
MFDELLKTSLELPANWDENGFAANEKMIADFSAELHAQGILAREMTPLELFPFDTDGSRTGANL